MAYFPYVTFVSVVSFNDLTIPAFCFVELVSPYNKKNITHFRRYEFYVLVARTISHFIYFHKLRRRKLASRGAKYKKPLVPNRLFPSLKNSHFIPCMSIKIHFHINACFALRLALKQRLRAIRKWPIHPGGYFRNFWVGMCR